MKQYPILIGALLCGAASAQLVDEVARGAGRPGTGGSGPAGQIIDRSMRESVSLQAIQEAFDNSDPRANTKEFAYDAGVTYKLRLREFMDTTVALPEGEEIAAYSLADTKNFEFHPYTPPKGKDSVPELRNLFRVLGKYPGADTNLTVIGGSKRIYSFYLRVDSVKSQFMPVLVARIVAPPLLVFKDAGAPVSQAKPGKGEAAAEPESKETQPAGNKPAKDGLEAEKEADYLRQLDIPSARDISTKYGMSGEKELAPVKVFDDGVWTYFKFAEENLDRVKRLPALYKVVDGVDSPVNTRVVKGTIIAETTSKGWTLRNGDAHLCIRKQ